MDKYLIKLLRLAICEKCPSSVKRKKDYRLMCNWGESKPCGSVPNCGSWPDYLNTEGQDELTNK